MYVRVPAFGSLLSDIASDVGESAQKVVGGVLDPDPAVVRLSGEQQNAIGAFVGDDGRPFCTATAIAPRVVISAAHCGAVRVGSRFVSGRDTLSPEFSARVLAVARHPKYLPGTSQSDFLLAYVDRDLPAVLGIGGPPSVGEVVQTVGYGRTVATETGNTRRWWLVERVREVRPEDFLVWSSGQHGMCMGDSGGPALRMEGGKPVVVGTVSWGEGDCTGTDVFKRADVAADWIRGIIDGWKRSPPAEIRQAGIGWIIGLLVAGLAIGFWARSSGRRGG